MAFSRNILPARRIDEEALTRAMVGIGMNFAASPDADANIEDTLLFASEAGMDGGDLRTLAVLMTWLGVHAARLNADRLVRLVHVHPSLRVRAFWAAFAHWQRRDRRFARLMRAHEGPPLDLLPVGTDLQLRRRGEDERFADSPLRVPKGTLRDRLADVLDATTLCRRHRAFRHRVMMGPTYRADVWAALEDDPGASAARLARATYSSFSTAWQARRDFHIAHGSHRPSTTAGDHRG